ncbi:hypothetical protein DRO97_01535 [Archaeoglobales archaeon]|nr:MAG: hypothetical protein DRO97_01535 [Archaeoglobales archaeon]
MDPISCYLVVNDKKVEFDEKLKKLFEDVAKTIDAEEVVIADDNTTIYLKFGKEYKLALKLDGNYMGRAKLIANKILREKLYNDDLEKVFKFAEKLKEASIDEVLEMYAKKDKE